jgi:hypothetical protein
MVRRSGLIQEFLRARFMYPRAIPRVRTHTPSASGKRGEPILFYRSCWPAAGIMAAFQFAEFGIIRWQLAKQITAI